MPIIDHKAEGDILDVLIVGAGLSGIGAARHLQRHCPGKRYAIVEARARLGGTWDLFRYPGIRSDSDMHTLGYGFKPWTGAKAIADGPAILRYIRETADEAAITPLIRFGHVVRNAAWSSRDGCWSVQVQGAATGAPLILRARFLYMCCGYFSYAHAHRPEFPGEADFRGTVVHPQFWPEGLDHAGKRVVVIGSGATAVTLVPELARTAAHVTMVQRSPSYLVTLPSRDRLAKWLERGLPGRLAYALTRWKNVLTGMVFYQLARRFPAHAKRYLVKAVLRQLGPDAANDIHFTPRYRPWDQRICAVPDGDLFKAIRTGQVSVLTDSVESFTRAGLRLAASGALAADIVVLATGLELNVLGEVTLQIDGQACDPGRTMAYKGMMLSGVPNLAIAFGYTNSSWTLKADLTAGYVCRLLHYMDRHGYASAEPRFDPTVPQIPFLSFTSGYVQRAAAILPRQGARRPWRVYQNYLLDLLTLRYGRIADGVLQFRSTGSGP